MVLLRFMAGERHALLASPFVMFAPLMLRYGYEIRMYSLIPFLSVLGTYLLLRARMGCVRIGVGRDEVRRPFAGLPIDDGGSPTP